MGKHRKGLSGVKKSMEIQHRVSVTPKHFFPAKTK